MGTDQSFSTHLISGFGAGREILNLFKFDKNANPTRPDLLRDCNINYKLFQSINFLLCYSIIERK